ncbi:glycosyltransferase family 39 protein [Candidatus Pacearchaeota archaeon]|nr:glycosyltransferase family 39 protein [Candidatus Pacearchaeota archaeon]
MDEKELTSLEKKETETKFSSRKEKVFQWLKDNRNLILLSILVFAFAIRMYYFFMTTSQPLWWDEAEYMLKAKNIAFGTPDTGWWYGRPILFPVISALFLKIGLGEIGLRFLWVLLSVANVFLVYYVAKSLFNKRVGLISAAIISVSYIDLFYTFRLLVNLPEIFFVLLAYSFFVKYEFNKGSNKFVWAIIPILLIGALIRFTIGIALIILLIYLLITKGIKLFKEKNWYISFLLGVLCFLPYGIYSWIKYGSPLYVILSVLVGSTGQRSAIDTPFKIFMDYVKYLPAYTHWVLFIFFIVGLVFILFNLIFLFDLLKKDDTIKRNLFLILALVIPLIYFGFFVNHFEDRYLSMALPIMFILIAKGLDLFYEQIKKYSHYTLAMIIILGILLFGVYNMAIHSNAIIKDKINSYEDLRNVGLWIKENSSPNDAIVSAGMPEITYYSERSTFKHADNLSDQMALIKEKNAKYIILTNWERSPDWTYQFFSNQSEFTPVYQSVNQNGQQTYAIVFSAIN